MVCVLKSELLRPNSASPFDNFSFTIQIKPKVAYKKIKYVI